MLRTIIAVVLGLIVGSMVNMGLITIGAGIVPAPDGMDVSNPESVAALGHLFEPRHFVFPFLAHALGTLSGALTAYLIAQTHRTFAAAVVGGITLFGGIAAAFMIPAPVWFIAADLLLAYIPMAWVATILGERLRPSHP
ncbi:MAG: hypothetical protein AAF541_05460 [Pseudomonadota bacterium]